MEDGYVYIGGNVLMDVRCKVWVRNVRCGLLFNISKVKPEMQKCRYSVS